MLRASAAALGVHQVRHLGYADSGSGPILFTDPQGGCGHPDHVKVHRVGALAAQMTGTRILEATLPRELAARLFIPPGCCG